MKVNTGAGRTFGRSAVGVRARLAYPDGDGWAVVSVAETNGEGRVENWEGWHLDRGRYRIVFDSDSYFSSLGASIAYPEVIVIFRVPDESSASRVQVTLSRYSYSTYCGAIQSHLADLQ